LLLSVVIPAYNEETVIEATVRSLEATLSRACIDHEILVVNDGSGDGTESLLTRLETEIESLRHENNPGPHGYGYAVRYGLDRYRGDAVVITMADGSDAPADLVAYFNQIEAGYDCAFGSRFTGGPKVDGYPAVKRVINRLGNRLIGLMLRASYGDFTNGFKCYRRCVIDAMQPLVSGQFNLTIEMSIKAVASGASFALVPTDWCDREAGISKFKLLAQSRLYLLTLFYTLTVVRIKPSIARPARLAGRKM
jgi:dolichol-phosphate mannosyltransferase